MNDPSELRSMIELASELWNGMRSHRLAPAEIEQFVAELPDSAFEGWSSRLGIAAKGPDPLLLLALAVLNEQAGIRKKDTPEQLARLATTTASAFTDIDQLALAKRAQARAHDAAERIADAPARDQHHLFLAIQDVEIARRENDFAAAAQIFQSLEPLFERSSGEPAMRLSLRGSEGLLYRRHGRLVEALQIYQNAQALADEVEAAISARRVPEHESAMVVSQVSKFFNGYANALSDAADEIDQDRASPELRELAERAMGIADKNASLTNAARAHSVQLLEHAIRHAEAIQSYEFLGTQHHNAARLLGQLDRGNDALKRMAKASEYAQRIPGHPMTTPIAVFMAQHAIVRGNGPSALEHWRAAVCNEMRRVLEHAGARPELREPVIIHEVLQTTRHGADPCQAILLFESLKGIKLARTIAHGIPGFDSDAALARDLTMLSSRREALRYASADPSAPSAELDAIESELERVQRELQLRSPALSSWTNAFGLEPARAQHLRDVLAEIGPGTVLLGMEDAPAGKLWVYTVSADEIVIAMVSQPPSGSGPEALAATVFPPITPFLERLAPSDRIVFTGPPSVPLASMPFRGRRLCERATISFVKSVSVLLMLQQRECIPLNTGTFLGDPARTGERLPGAAQEADELARMFEPTGKALIGQDATVASLKQNLDCDILHIAAHALAAGQGGARWGTLLLAPDAAGDSGELSEDRVLRELALREGAFVNLATCVSAHQRERAGFVDGGLVNAFFAVGARSILATTRSIHDQRASRFQRELYEHLENGHSPATSLAETQRACLRGEHGAELADPAVWASFQLFGI